MELTSARSVSWIVADSTAAKSGTTNEEIANSLGGSGRASVDVFNAAGKAGLGNGELLCAGRHSPRCVQASDERQIAAKQQPRRCSGGALNRNEAPYYGPRIPGSTLRDTYLVRLRSGSAGRRLLNHSEELLPGHADGEELCFGRARSHMNVRLDWLIANAVAKGTLGTPKRGERDRARGSLRVLMTCPTLRIDLKKHPFGGHQL